MSPLATAALEEARGLCPCGSCDGRGVLDFPADAPGPWGEERTEEGPCPECNGEPTPAQVRIAAALLRRGVNAAEYIGCGYWSAAEVMAAMGAAADELDRTEAPGAGR